MVCETYRSSSPGIIVLCFMSVIMALLMKPLIAMSTVLPHTANHDFIEPGFFEICYTLFSPQHISMHAFSCHPFPPHRSLLVIFPLN